MENIKSGLERSIGRVPDRNSVFSERRSIISANKGGGDIILTFEAVIAIFVILLLMGEFPFLADLFKKGVEAVGSTLVNIIGAVIRL